MFKSQIFVDAVHCFCQRSKSRRVYVRLLFYSIFISMLSIYYNIVEPYRSLKPIEYDAEKMQISCRKT